ncbi:TetR/AcrR family transcriptional regulator [Sphingomonas sp. KC8]|uniref:TetR/AcrR family transcriptional regulator n=1 Tax=Sphingomonas sp. KC8 TaxID=1030157 RepID=UPI000248860B|nr:TetR/AcrR family transcriptional regulator [Sphingomonas sp. KC8]
MMSRRRPDDSRPDARAQILAAAGEVFLREGFARTSVDQIAATAHMSKQSIYELFPSKMDLFEAAVRNTLDMADRNLAAVDDVGDIEATLRRFGLRLFEGFANPVNFGLFRANIVAATRFPKLAAELHEHRLAMVRRFADYVERCIADGALAPVDPLTTGIRFGGMSVEGARYFLGLSPPSLSVRAEIVGSIVDLFLNGYRGQTDPDGGTPMAAADQMADPVLESGATLRLTPEKLESLIDATLGEFLDNGYRGASLDRIATSVRASKATLYRQFGNKEGLFRYAVQREIAAASRTKFAVATSGTMDEAVTNLARQALDWHLAPTNIQMHRLLIQESELVPDLARDYHDVRVARLGSALCELLAAYGQPVPNETAIRAFYALATFAVRFLTLHVLPDNAQRDLLSCESARLFLHGVRPGPEART